MRVVTASVWAVSLLNLAAAGLITTLFVVIATSLDPTEIVTAGIEPFTDAIVASAGFLGIAVLTALSLRLWHTKRFKPLSLTMIVSAVACVAWASMRVYQDYL